MPEPSRSHLMIIAGEASGDHHAASLVREIRALRPDITFSGLGGNALKRQGVELYHDLTDMAVVGFWEVIKHYGEFKRIFNDFVARAEARRPEAVILVDYPGFNLRMAKALKKRNIKVFYYISPQIWAWKKNRIHVIQQAVDHIFVFFPFEESLYRRAGVPVTFIGHPLLDSAIVRTPADRLLNELGLSADRPTIGLLPGSRRKEIETLLPIMLDTAGLIARRHPGAQFLLLLAPTVQRQTVEPFLKHRDLTLRVLEHQTYDGINASQICLVASGTATLDTAILNKPMVIIYKTSLPTWLLARLFIRIPHIGLVNVVAGKTIVPECIQFQATPERIARQMEDVFTNELKIVEIKSELRKVTAALGDKGAAHRAAKAIIGLLTAQPDR